MNPLQSNTVKDFSSGIQEKIEDALLAEIAKILNVPEEAIRNFDEETAINNIQYNYDNCNAVAFSFRLSKNQSPNIAKLRID